MGEKHSSAHDEESSSLAKDLGEDGVDVDVLSVTQVISFSLRSRCSANKILAITFHHISLTSSLFLDIRLNGVGSSIPSLLSLSSLTRL